MTTFNSRETYITWRAQWRADYAALSVTIRSQKLQFKNAQRRYEISNITLAEYWNTVAILTKSQRTAKEMLADREQSKIEAGRQRALRIQGELICS